MVGVAGNHDFVGEIDSGALRDLDWHYLQDETVVIDGLSYFGSPWTSRFQDWAFMLSEQELEQRWALIPDGIDVLCVHSPPFGYGDWISGHTIGSPRCSPRSTRAGRSCASSGTCTRVRTLAARRLHARQRGLHRHGLPPGARARRRRALTVELGLGGRLPGAGAATSARAA